MPGLPAAPWKERLPQSATEARSWIKAGWEPSKAEIAKLGEAGARRLGLEYVEVRGLSPLGWLVVVGIAGFLVWKLTRR